MKGMFQHGISGLSAGTFAESSSVSQSLFMKGMFQPGEMRKKLDLSYRHYVAIPFYEGHVST